MAILFFSGWQEAHTTTHPKMRESGFVDKKLTHVNTEAELFELLGEPDNIRYVERPNASDVTFYEYPSRENPFVVIFNRQVYAHSRVPAHDWFKKARTMDDVRAVLGQESKSIYDPEFQIKTYFFDKKIDNRVFEVLEDKNGKLTLRSYLED